MGARRVEYVPPIAVPRDWVQLPKLANRGWVKTTNSRYETDVMGTQTPWLVAKIAWTRDVLTYDKNDDAVEGRQRILECFDSRRGLRCRCYRLQSYDAGAQCWTWIAPGNSKVPFFSSLAAAQAALASLEERDWEGM